MSLQVAVDEAMINEASRLSGQPDPQIIIRNALREYIDQHRPKADPMMNDSIMIQSGRFTVISKASESASVSPDTIAQAIDQEGIL